MCTLLGGPGFTRSDRSGAPSAPALFPFADRHSHAQSQAPGTAASLQLPDANTGLSPLRPLGWVLCSLGTESPAFSQLGLQRAHRHPDPWHIPQGSPTPGPQGRCNLPSVLFSRQKFNMGRAAGSTPPYCPTLLPPVSTFPVTARSQQECEFAFWGRNLKAAHLWGAVCAMGKAAKCRGPGQGASPQRLWPPASVCPRSICGLGAAKLSANPQSSVSAETVFTAMGASGWGWGPPLRPPRSNQLPLKARPDPRRAPQGPWHRQLLDRSAYRDKLVKIHQTDSYHLTGILYTCVYVSYFNKTLSTEMNERRIC